MRVIALVLVAACGSSGSHAKNDAAIVPSDAAVDASAGTDAPRDAPAMGSDAATTYPAVQLTPGANRVVGGPYTMDIQIGLPFSQAPTSGNNTTFEANTAIKP